MPRVLVTPSASKISHPNAPRPIVSQGSVFLAFRSGLLCGGISARILTPSPAEEEVS
jgi:hypothetical protein